MKVADRNLVSETCPDMKCLFFFCIIFSNDYYLPRYSWSCASISNTVGGNENIVLCSLKRRWPDLTAGINLSKMKEYTEKCGQKEYWCMFSKQIL